MYTMSDAERNRITRRVNTIIRLIEKHGKGSMYLRNYISDCMESDIRREKERMNKVLNTLYKKGEVK